MARRHLEDDLQTQVAQYLRLQYPQLLWFAVPNGGKRNAREASRLKAMGLRAGVADILMFWRKSGDQFLNGFSHNTPYCGAIELKIGKNTQQDTQKIFQQQWLHAGGQYAICRTLEDVIIVLKDWNAPRVTRCPSALATGAVVERYTAKRMRKS